MTIDHLPGDRARHLAAQPLAYAPTGMIDGPTPPGFTRLQRSRASTRRDLDALGRDLLSWQVQARSGFDVRATDIPLRLGTDVEMRLGPGRLGLRIPCQVVEVVEESDRVGFTYGTLPGHPEEGEERFLLERDAQGQVVMTVSAISRPALAVARLVSPVVGLLQTAMADRYLRVFDR